MAFQLLHKQNREPVSRRDAGTQRSGGRTTEGGGLRSDCPAHNDGSLTLPRPACERAHKGGSGAWTLRTHPPPVQHPNNAACTCDVLRRRFMGRTLLQTAHRRVPSEGVSFPASPSGFSPHPLVPGLFSFRARVILLADGPTRPSQRLPVRGKVPIFPHPEPPLLLVLLGVAPSPGPNRGLSVVTAMKIRR